MAGPRDLRTNADQIIGNAVIARGVLVERYKAGLSRSALRRLRTYERKLNELLREYPYNGISTRNAQQLIARIARLTDETFGAVEAFIVSELDDFAQDVVEAQVAILGAAANTDRKVPATVKGGKIVVKGKKPAEKLKGTRAGIKAAVTAAVLEAVTEDLSREDLIDALAREEIKRARRGFERDIRTLAQGVEIVNSEAAFALNKDILIGLVWTSVLDNHTSKICIARDGQWRAVSKSKPLPNNIPDELLLKPPFARPPAHPWCRSRLRPVTILQRQLLKKIGPGTRAARGEDGPFALPGDTSMTDFLSSQSDEFLFGTSLGKKRTELFRAGLPLSNLIDEYGQPLTLNELRDLFPKYWNKTV